MRCGIDGQCGGEKMTRTLLSFALALALVVPVSAQVAKEVEVVKVKGKWVKTSGTDQFVVLTGKDKQVTYYTTPTTRYIIDTKPVKVTDFKEGSDVTVVYVADGDRYVVKHVYVGDEVKEEEATFYEGKVVKVVGENQVVIQTADNKEVIVFVDPKTTYTFNEKQAVYTDIKPGMDIRVDYQLREKRPYARSIRSVIRR